MTNQRSVPVWILIVSGILSLMGFIVSASLIFTPEKVLPTVDLTAKGIDYLIYMWAARQFAEAFLFAYSALKRSITMLTLSYIFFLVMNMGDFLIGLSENDTALTAGALVMCILAPTMIYFLNKTTKASN